MDLRHLLGLAFVLATGALYLYVGARVARRQLDGDAQLASKAFASWWLALGGITLLGALQTLLFVVGVRDLAVYLTVTHLLVVALCGGFWALNYYLVYLYTGSRRWLLPTIAYWTVIYLVLVYYVTALHPVGVRQVGTTVSLENANEPTRAFSIALGIAAIAPMLASAIAYARLYFRVDDVTQRYRIALVAGSLSLWLLILMLGSVITVDGAALSRQPWWTYVSRSAALLAALGVLLAYNPPGFLRKRYGILPIDEPVA